MKISDIKQWFSSSSGKFLSLAVGIGLLAGCNTTPETVRFDPPNVDFNQVSQAPNSYAGDHVRWGGIVARVENLERDTLVEIVNLPLDSSARPLAEHNTGGRFIARIQGFADPLIYKQGKEITVVGVLSEPLPGKIGKHAVVFPVVDTASHHLWAKRKSRQYIDVYSTWDPYWFYGGYYRWHYPYYHYPYWPRRHVIYREDSSEDHLPVAPSPTHRVQPISQQKVNLDEVERVTLRDGRVEEKSSTKRKSVEARKPKVYKPRVPKTPRRIHPKIHQEMLPKPKAPIRGPMRVEN
ncbi:Slp family lipoprotein [Kangiella sp. TOML190]|uniref:Slp family lipoprotein n=1 Tax=Kangiella sp. TOML190 TaxID=2931351 RepID=UPI00203B2FDA|nr:Slp family lipoprotein [Kangiella sp. TOML190]